MRVRSFVFILATVFGPCACTLCDEPAKVQAPADDPLLTLNGSFRKAHAAARKEMLAKCGPIVLLDGDKLILLRKGKRTEAEGTPEIYHTLKAVAHVPVAIQLLLAPYAEERIGMDRLAGLKEYRAQLVRASKALAGRGLSKEQRERSNKIMSACLDFLDKVIKDERAARDSVKSFCRETAPLVLAQATDAAQAQLDTTHAQMKKWRSEMSDEEWKSLHIVIIGSAMPRKGNLAVQYFARLLHEKGEGLRILYAESQREEAKALNLLAVSLVDSNMAIDFFGDELRMHEDLLAPIAAQLLKKMDLEK